MPFPFFHKKRRQSHAGKTLRFSQSSHSQFSNNHRKRLLKKRFHFLKPLIFFTIVLSFIGILFFSPYFKIASIEVGRQNLSIDSSAIEIFLSREALGENIFQISLTDLSGKLKEEFPQWKSIRISKNYPQSLEVSVENYSAFAYIKIKTHVQKEAEVQEGSELTESDAQEEKNPDIIMQETIEENEYIINELGHISYPEIGDNPDLSIIYDEILEGEISVGRNIVFPEDMKNIQAIMRTLLNDYDLAAKSVRYFRSGKEAHFDVYQFSLWFDLAQDISEQFEKFDQGLRILEKANVEYFDLRISDRIIYKEKGE